MKESFQLSIDELKRVDHLFYVSLKYTRTVDVLNNVLLRMISCMEFGFESILKVALENKKIEAIPANVGLRLELLKETYPNDPILLDYITFFTFMRRLTRAKQVSRQEFRRHVTMIATIDSGEVVEITIDVVKEYYDKIRTFIEYTKSKIEEFDNGGKT